MKVTEIIFSINVTVFKHCKHLWLLLQMVLFAIQIQAQKAKPALVVIKTYKHYCRTVTQQPLKKMVSVKNWVPYIIYDLKYAGTGNFMKRRMYEKNTTSTFLRKPAAEALVKVAEDLKKLGFGIKIWDGYRPYAVSKKFWELVHDERYVADPAKGSNHNRGTAVDITLVDIHTGHEINMGTGFDNFTDSAHHHFKNLPNEVLQNRALLKSTMEKYGFTALATEWWHYSYNNSGIDFEVLDIPFKKL